MSETAKSSPQLSDYGSFELRKSPNRQDLGEFDNGYLKAEQASIDPEAGNSVYGHEVSPYPSSVND